MPRASASITTMPYVSARDGSTSRSAPAYAASSASPVRGPTKWTRPWPAAGNPGARSRAPTQTQLHGKSSSLASASSSTSWPLRGMTAATQSSRSPVGLPTTSGAGATPGGATCIRCGGTP
jgi:hypothetical protein